MYFALVILKTINPWLVTMHHNKETQKGIVIIEAALWVFWAFVFLLVTLSTQILF